VLLGAHQREGYLPWDKDIDLAVTPAASQMLRLHDPLRAWLFARGLWMCPAGNTLIPLWPSARWLVVDISVWYDSERSDEESGFVPPENEDRTVGVLDGGIQQGGRRNWTLVQRRKGMSTANLAVWATYFDHPTEWLRPLRRISFGPLRLPAPARTDLVLQHQYPHSYWLSFPYNPRCWLTMLTSQLPSSPSLSSARDAPLVPDPFLPHISLFFPPPTEVSFVQRRSNASTPADDKLRMYGFDGQEGVKVPCRQAGRVPLPPHAVPPPLPATDDCLRQATEGETKC